MAKRKTGIDETRYINIANEGSSLQQVSIHRHGPNGMHSLSVQNYMGRYVDFTVHLTREEFAAVYAAMGEVLAAGHETETPQKTADAAPSTPQREDEHDHGGICDDPECPQSPQFVQAAADIARDHATIRRTRS